MTIMRMMKLSVLVLQGCMMVFPSFSSSSWVSAAGTKENHPATSRQQQELPNRSSDPKPRNSVETNPSNLRRSSSNRQDTAAAIQQSQSLFPQQPQHRWLDHENNTQICPPCPVQCNNNDKEGDDNNGIEEPELTLQILVVDSPGIITMVQWNANDYYRFTNGRVKIEIKLTATMPALFEEIESNARAGGGLYDAYYTNPVILGSAAMLNGFLDLTDYVKASPYADWTDVLLALRTHVTSFEDKIYIILLDGDTHTMFYRKDVLEHFQLPPPRTWNEYNAIAKAVHGLDFFDKTTNTTTKLSGSCISRIRGDHAMYFYHLVLSTITQTQGTDSGSLFDTKDMTPLTGEAMMEMLRIHEEQAKYGTPDEFEDIINHVQNGHMNDGTCVMTHMWGDMFRRSKAEGSVLHDKLGIAPTPGSEFVLDRSTGKLERCTKELCPYAKYYEDIGFVNVAPYAANGGWGAAVSAHTTPEKQQALAEFFLWASSRKQSQQYVIPNATLPWYSINGQDPWRQSQLDVDLWVAQGYDRELSRQYVESISSNLVSKNVVVEARFPKAGEIMSVLDKEVHDYLKAAHFGDIAEDDKEKERRKTAQSITDQWNQIIRAYDSRGDTVAPILEIYQRLRGVYVPNEQFNYLDKIRPVGLTFMCIIWALAASSAVWVYLKRDTRVVRASQPPFLGLICLGTVVMSSSIIPMGVDESIASDGGCTTACRVTPWLLAVGFSITFSALASKLRRLKILIKNAAQFRRIQVKVKDVLVPFAVILALNTIFLLVWTLVDPLYWERVSKGRTESNEVSSYGRCKSDGKVSWWMFGLLAVTNIVALFYANILAYQTRNLSVAFHESKFVGLSMASILQAMLIGLPLLFLSDSNPTAFYVVRCLLVFVICLSVLLFIFVPKMMERKFLANSGPGSVRISMGGNAHTSFSNPDSIMGNRSSDYKRSSDVKDSRYTDASSANFRLNDASSANFRLNDASSRSFMPENSMRAVSFQPDGTRRDTSQLSTVPSSTQVVTSARSDNDSNGRPDPPHENDEIAEETAATETPVAPALAPQHKEADSESSPTTPSLPPQETNEDAVVCTDTLHEESGEGEEETKDSEAVLEHQEETVVFVDPSEDLDDEPLPLVSSPGDSK